MIVADTNLVAYLLIPGAKSALSEDVLKRDARWATPLIGRSELRNVLALYMRHQGMTLTQAQQTIVKAERLLGLHEYAVPSAPVLQLASESALSAYDAEFVVLAQSLRIPLVTFDKGILATFPRIAVHPDKFVKS